MGLCEPGFVYGFWTASKPAWWKPFLEGIDDESQSILVNPEALYLNMLIAEADYLHTLPQWEDVLSDVKRAAINKAYKKPKSL
jgi:hypothetical protein